MTLGCTVARRGTPRFPAHFLLSLFRPKTTSAEVAGNARRMPPRRPIRRNCFISNPASPECGILGTHREWASRRTAATIAFPSPRLRLISNARRINFPDYVLVLRRQTSSALEWNIFVADRGRGCCVLWLGSALVEIISGCGGAPGASAGIVSGAFAASAQHDQVVGDDFGFVLLLAGFF